MVLPPTPLNLHSEVGRDGSEAIVAPWIILTWVESGEAEGAAPNTCTGSQVGENTGWLQLGCLTVCIWIYNCTLPGAVRKVQKLIAST